MTCQRRPNLGGRRHQIAHNLGLVLALTAIGGCNHHAEGQAAERGTLLEAPAVDGGVSVLPPDGHTSWAGSFSALPLCLTAGDRAVRIKEFRALESSGTVDELHAMLVTPRQNSLPFVSALGAAPDFTEPYAADERRYAEQLQFDTNLEGIEITQACSTTTPQQQFSLAVSFATDRDGGQVREWELIYESDGKTFTTGPVPWEMTLCGANRNLTEAC